MFRPFLVLKPLSQWSHLNSKFSSEASWLGSTSASTEMDFFIKNSCLRLAFLLSVDGLFFVLAGKVSLPSLASKEKVKVELMVRENLNFLPWLASAWQKSMHLVAKEVSSPLEGAVIIAEIYF